MIIGRIDYCNSLVFKIPAIHVKKLQRVQNYTARLVSSILIFDHKTPILYRLHWLPVPFTIEFKVLMLIFKSIYGVASVYLCQLVRIKQEPKHNLRSSAERLLTSSPANTKKTLGDRAFQAAAPTLWTKLSANIRAITNFEQFQNK